MTLSLLRDTFYYRWNPVARSVCIVLGPVYLRLEMGGDVTRDLMVVVGLRWLCWLYFRRWARAHTALERSVVQQAIGGLSAASGRFIIGVHRPATR